MKEPFKPWAPIEPKEYLEHRHHIVILGDMIWTIDILIGHLPKGITLNDLRFSNTVSYDGGVDIWYMEQVKNTRYKSELKHYQQVKETYDVALVKYNEEMRVYTAWKEAEELKALEKRLTELKRKQKKEVEELEELNERIMRQNVKLEQLNKGAGKKKC